MKSAVEQVLGRIVRRASALVADREQAAPDDEEELALAQSLTASARCAPSTLHRPEDSGDLLPHRLWLPTRRKARIHGFDLDAEVAVKEHERDRLEHLCRYVLRPPIALDRLTILGPDLIGIELKRPWRDGTTHVSMSVSTFLGRLASLVPRPRVNTTLYAGVLAAHAKDRPAITPKSGRKTSRAHDASWAALMKHSFGLDVLSCRRCKGRMRFVAVLFDSREIRRLLEHLRLWSEPLPAQPARAPPEYPENLEFP